MNKKEFIEKYGIDCYNDIPRQGRKKDKDKYSECKNQVLKYAWKYLEPRLKEFFNIDLKYEMRLIPKYVKRFGMVILYQDGKEIGTMCALTDRVTNHKSLRIGHDYYVRTDSGIQKRYNYFVNFRICDVSEEGMEAQLEYDYISKIQTGIVELLNYLDLQHDVLKAEYEKQEDEFLNKLTEEPKPSSK